MEHYNFKVQGSAIEPYEIKIYHNEGNLNYCTCSCPANSSGGLICKHIISVLIGETSNLVEPNFEDLKMASSLIKEPIFVEKYLELKELQKYEFFYETLKNNKFYLNGKLNNNIENINEELSKNIVIKLREEKNFIETSFSYEYLAYLDFFDKDLNYLFSTKSNLLDNTDFLDNFNKLKYKLDSSIKPQKFYTNNKEVISNLKIYSTQKKKISDLKKQLRDIVENLYL